MSQKFSVTQIASLVPFALTLDRAATLWGARRCAERSKRH
jgi:hypothetical protein